MNGCRTASSGHFNRPVQSGPLKISSIPHDGIAVIRQYYAGTIATLSDVVLLTFGLEACAFCLRRLLFQSSDSCACHRLIVGRHGPRTNSHLKRALGSVPCNFHAAEAQSTFSADSLFTRIVQMPPRFWNLSISRRRVGSVSSAYLWLKWSAPEFRNSRGLSNKK